MNRIVHRAIASFPLRRLRGQPLLEGVDRKPLIRELLAPLSGERDLCPTEEELQILRRELNVDSLRDHLTHNPGPHLRDQLDLCSPEHPEHVDQHAALILAVSSFSASQLHDPDLMLALEQTEYSWNFWTNHYESRDMGVASAYILRLHQVSPKGAWHAMNRLIAGLKTSPPPEVITTLAASKNDDPPARQLARSLIGLPGDRAVRSALSATLPEVIPNIWRPALAAASWRSGVYDRSRHPRRSIENALQTSTVRDVSAEIRDACAAGGARRLTALTVLARECAEVPHDGPSLGGEWADPRLIGIQGPLMWNHDCSLPVADTGKSSEGELYNLTLTYAGNALTGILTPEEESLVLTLCALLGPGAHTPEFIRLPAPEVQMELLRRHDPSLLSPNDPRIREALQELIRARWVPEATTRSAMSALKFKMH